MKPLFPFYGSKWRDAKRYPGPTGKVVEPFAGSAGYSCYWEPDHVMLIDIDPIIIGVWQYLISASQKDILRLPDLPEGCSVDDLDLCQEAKWLIGFWLNRGSAQPKKTMTVYSRRTERSQLIWSERARDRIATSVHLIRRWRIVEGDYRQSPSRGDVTYFVDPPYTDKGRYYRYSEVDYLSLASWVKVQRGQIIVCEQDGADWLPFQPLATIKSSRGTSQEVVYLG